MRQLAILTVVAFAVTLSSDAAAQQTVAGPPMTQAECQNAATALSSRAPAWQWERLNECGSVGTQALANAVSAARLTTDVTFLESLYRSVSDVRDVGLLQASMQLAEDKTATTPARVLALLTVLSQRARGVWPVGRTFSQLATVPMGSFCRIKTPSENLGYATDLGLAVSYLQSAVSRSAAIAADASENSVVRGLARCVSNSVAVDAPAAVDPQLITVEYVCGTKYRLRNSATRLVDLAYQVFHGPERGELTVPAGGEAFIITHCLCGFELRYQGQTIRDAQNGQIPCPP